MVDNPRPLALTIQFPLTQRQAQAVIVAADAMGCEPWEMAVHVLEFRRKWFEWKARDGR